MEDDSNLNLKTKLQIDEIMELADFIATTTYFRFRGKLCRQKFGTASGSAVSPILANPFMEWLERTAIETAPVTIKLKLWKRYVDDVLEIVLKGEIENLTNHLNQVDNTGSIKFSHEVEQDG